MAVEPSIEILRTLVHDKISHIPIYVNVIADLDTPVSAYLKLKSLSKSKTSFLLESVTLGNHLSRYSFIGISSDIEIVSEKEDPLLKVEKKLKEYKVLEMDALSEIPFLGGAVGYCSFDCVRYFEPSVEKFIEKQKDVLKIPESIYRIYDTVVVFDHAFHTLKIVTHVDVRGDIEKEYQKGVHEMEEIKKALLENSIPRVEKVDQRIDWDKASNVGRDGYEQFVHTLREHIVDGDIFQAVPSQRLKVEMPKGVSAFELYRQMRMINPSPYMYYLDMGNGFQIVGASPEMLVKVTKDRMLETHPIAGTRHRGKNAMEDEQLAKELLSDEKERAEHIMLVDLGRNDIGRVAKPGTVKVATLMNIEKYSHVMHIVSVVTGELREDKSVFDAYRAVFPAGTVSGAPKVKAMQLVCGLETERRGVYSGSVGYFGFSGTLDTAIAIRTIVVHDNHLYLQAGGGIVYDSNAADEYQESMNKLGSAIRTVEKTIQQTL